MTWSIQESIYLCQKTAKIACVHAPERQECFYWGVTQAYYLGFFTQCITTEVKVSICYGIFLAAYEMEFKLGKPWIVDFLFFWLKRQEIPLVEAKTLAKWINLLILLWVCPVMQRFSTRRESEVHFLKSTNSV